MYLRAECEHFHALFSGADCNKTNTVGRRSGLRGTLPDKVADSLDCWKRLEL
jgi:hypothetical protein